MSWFNYHTHTHFCDGKGTPQEFVDRAVRSGMTALGFSSHAPISEPVSWAMKENRLPDYIHAVRSVSIPSGGHLKVHLGLEADFIPGTGALDLPSPISSYLDFVIGAVHFIARNPNGSLWAVDSSPDAFAAGIESIFEGNIRKAVRLYYRQIAAMASGCRFDILAHLDIIKKNNIGELYFNEREDWYRRIIRETLDAIARSGKILEVNTGGMSRGFTSEPYPDSWILAECFRRDIPVTISSDAHHPDTLTAGFDTAARLLTDAGYRMIQVLTDTGWTTCRFDQTGIQNGFTS
ncbi:histidinol-phosphatase [bacterium]|nr:histidinol-phosphatase [candidate division CSSED10-310 bacterium]